MTAAVVGLDLSITSTGVASCSGETFTVHTKTEQGDRRLTRIRNDIHAWVTVADLVVIEDLPTHAHGSGITGMVHGVVRELCLDLHIPYVLVTPATVKKYATGKGNATKADMRMALFQRTGLDERDDNRVDAWWLRAAGLDALGCPVVDLPKSHRDALAKVIWPLAVAS